MVMNESKKDKKGKTSNRQSVQISENKGDNSNSGGKNESWGKYLQQRREQFRDVGGSSRGRRSYGNKSKSQESNRTRIGNTDKRTNQEMEGEGSRLEFKFTLQEIRNSIPNEVLESLLSNKFSPNENIVIKKIPQRTKFVEDMYIRKKDLPKKRIRKPKKVKLPSEIFQKYINDANKKTEGILGRFYSLDN